MTTLTLLSLLLVSYCVNYCQSTDTGNETCRDRGVLGRIERNTKSCGVDQQSTLETVMEKLETLQSLLGGQQQEQQANVCELSKSRRPTKTGSKIMVAISRSNRLAYIRRHIPIPLTRRSVILSQYTRFTNR